MIIMGSESFLPTNARAMTTPASDKSMCTLDTPTTATMDSPSQNLDDSFGDRVDLSILRTPPTRTSISKINLALAVVAGDDIEVNENKKMKLTKRLSSAMKLQVNRPPIAVDIDEEKASTKNTQTISPKSVVPGSISSLSSFSQRDTLEEKSHKSIGPSLVTKRQGNKENICLSESIEGKSRDNDSFNPLNRPDNFVCELYPTMKLRATYVDDPAESSDHEDSQEVLARIPVSPGQNLPLPKGFKKHRKVSYRIRFATPELENINEDSNTFDNEDKDTPADESGVSRGGIRGIRGFNRSNNWVSYREPEIENNDDRDDGDLMSENGSYSLPADEQSETNSEMSRGGYCESYPPDVLVTPIKSKDGSQKWIAKRVWDMEDRDDEEPEYEVDHWCLMHGIRGLMGIPEEMGVTSEEWQVNIDESDPWDMSTNKDSAPILPKRTRDNYRPQLSVQKLIDLDGQCEESTSLPLNAENYRAQLKHVTFADLGQDLTDYSTLSDLGSDASDVCSFDYFYFSDNSSFTVSIQTTSTDDLSQQSEDEPEDSLENLKFSNHSQRGFGRPNEWVRPKDVYQESFESQYTRYKQRDFGIFDEWVSSSESDEASPECRSWRSPGTCRTGQDKSVRESLPEDDTPHSRKGGRRNRDINLDECKTSVGDMTEAHDGVNTNSIASEGKKYRDNKHQKKEKKITKGRKKKAIDNSLSLAMLNKCSIQLDSDSEHGYNEVTLTWEKRPIQESEKELSTKMWWDF